MANLTIFIPSELEGVAPDIQRFFDAMVFKLRKNAHKQPSPKEFAKGDGATQFKAMQEEVSELLIAMQEGNSVEVLLECADIANFALILANVKLGDPNDRSV